MPSSFGCISVTTSRFLAAVVWIGIATSWFACKPNEPEPPVAQQPFVATPYNLVIPPFFPPMDIPSDNPLTVEGIELGRFLFWEKKLSGDNTQSCGSCHIPSSAFSDPNQFSTGIHGDVGNRQAMALINLGWAYNFFWDGRSSTIEEQVIQPVINPIEMDETWENALDELRNDPIYPAMFKCAYGTEDITQERAAKAMASFLRTMVSAGSNFDKQRIGQYTFTTEEEHGFDLFIQEGGSPDDVPGGQFGADCFHCHGHGAMQMADYLFHNNGLNSTFENDPGLAAITGNPLDSGKFKAVTLRNIEFTAPYMHDGRFNTLDEVIGHYNSGGMPSTTIDPFMKFTTGGLQLSDASKSDLIAFLKCLTDTTFMNNPSFSDPH